MRLPFPASAFDLAWTQHVAMNIADRDGLYGEAFRVLRPGGRLAIFDVIAGPGGPLHYPAPWASGPEASFLLDADAMRAALEAQGFRIAAWVDCTEAGIAWFLEREAERAKAVPSPIAPSPLALGAIMGPDFAVATLNRRRNLQEGRAALVEVICEKD